MPDVPVPLTYDWRTVESRWDQAVLVLLVGLLAFLPLAFGVVEPWSELVVVLVAAALSLTVALRYILDRHFRPAWSWTFLPLAVVLALLVLQLVPLPPAVLDLLDPAKGQLRAELLAGHAPAATGEWSTLSLYRYETAHDLRLAVVFTAVFVAVATTFRTSEQIKRLLLAVLVIGAAEAAVAVLQIVTMSTKIHWMFADRGRIVTSGSFVNYSNFCQFVNLALGAGVGLLLVRMREDREADRSRSRGRRVSLVGWERYVPLLAGLVLGVVAVLLSMSRNGAISLFVASGVLGALLFWRGQVNARGWLLGMAPWLVLAILFLTSFDTVYERLATLEDRVYFDQRLEMTSGAVRAWQEFPLWGVGVGAHEFVFPLYDSAVTPLVAEHADNDWAQLLEEFGLVGTAAVVAFILSVLAVAWRLMLRGRSALSTAAFGLTAGLLAAAIHSLSDFGQHLPGVFTLTAVVSGLIVAVGRREAREKKRSRRHAAAGQTWARYAGGAAAVVGVGIVWAWAGQGALSAYRGDAWANAALAIEERLASVDFPVADPDQEYSDLLTAAGQAVAAEPTNVRHGYLLNLYRWQSISRARDPETGSVLLHPEVLPFVQEIAESLARVRTLCPTFGPPCGLEGELRLLVLGDPAGAALIRQAARLAPYHAPTSYVAGQLAVQEGKIDEAVGHLSRAVALDPGYFEAVARLYLEKIERPELAAALAGNDDGRLRRVADLLAAREPPDEASRKLAEELRARALELLRERVEAGQATAGEQVRLAEVAVADGDLSAAIALYRRALTERYDQVGWRLALVEVLVETGEIEQAVREARICLRLRPGSPAARQWIELLSVLPEGAAGPPAED